MKVDKVVDATGLSCPMPMIKTKKAMEEIAAGQVLEVDATDRGSLADIQSWAKKTGHQYLGTHEEAGVYKHFLRKADPREMKPGKRFSATISNEELQKKLEAGEVTSSWMYGSQRSMPLAISPVPNPFLWGNLKHGSTSLTPVRNCMSSAGREIAVMRQAA